jgi:lactate permease
MTWTQVYDPFNNWLLSTIVAALPVLVLLGLLAGLRVRAHICAIAGAGTAIVVSILAFGMPWQLAGSSFVYGMAFGFLKIVWIVIAAVYLYDLSVDAGEFEIIKHSVAGITSDRRLQLLLVAFCFGALIEGAAGFGTPVAIAGAFMIGLGFRPFQAAALNLIANTAPVAWGAIGTPVHTLAAVTALNESDLNAMIGRILPFTAIIVPFWLVKAMVNWEETFEVFPAILVVGASFAATQWFWANHMDSNLVDITSGAVSMVVTVIFLLFWHPKRIWRFPDEPETPPHTYTRWQVARAWLPFAILTVFVVAWGLPAVKGAMNRATTPDFSKGGWDVPYLHRTVSRNVPVVAKPTPENAKFDFNWLTATGTGCFFAAIISGILLGMGPGRMFKVFRHTLYRLRFAMVAMTCMLGLGFITRYSGMDAVLGLAFTRTGRLFPFFGTYIGWLGVALTGSDTSSNALFGGLQRITAEQLKLSPILMCAANSAGGVMGKMIDAQSIVIATAATNQVGNEGGIFRYVFWHSVALAAIVGLIVFSYAHWFPQYIPSGLTFVR